jgi:hypothetical protein
MLEKILKFAGVNTETGIITGASEGTPEFIHEQGHLEFQKTLVGANLQYLYETAHTYLLGCIAITFFINFFKYISLAIFLFMIFCILYEEFWANDYIKKVKNGETSKTLY